ncbi:MAG: adenylosuccinate lyase [Candidatus Methanomethylicota archaeon]|uniref:Adenylosuccinate lyase n=1 Tax=Thermoproteota archaeon TaxID=2056631 RepID=A0A497EQ43_9CREN|nr:MAG: adenylosuccinate lyase [Candidatus Verstraetearchaeota archaeon]
MSADERLVCPLEHRYGSIEMRTIFSNENILRKRLQVEVALAYGLAAAGFISFEEAKKIEEASAKVKLERIEELEKVLGHDIMALATSLAEAAESFGRGVHLGATSYDIVDTAWALIFRDALKIVKSKLKSILSMLMEYSKRYEDLMMVGRTHGQHALPITLGFKFANYVYELSRSLERIVESEKRLIRGKLSGAVGTMAAWGNKGLVVEAEALKRLGLKPHVISTQVAPRDGFAEIISALAILSSQLDRFAVEVRELMRPEIDELAEGVGVRVGSSTMPQKKNPVTAEKISGLAKVLRALTLTSLENIPLWHERDLTNSSSERILFSHVMLIIDEQLDSTISLLKNLIIKPESMRKNLEISGGAIMAEAIMVALVKKGMLRHEAHKLLREIERKAELNGISFKEALFGDPEAQRYLSREELEELLKPEKYLGLNKELIERALQYANEVLKVIEA